MYPLHQVQFSIGFEWESVILTSLFSLFCFFYSISSILRHVENNILHIRLNRFCFMLYLNFFFFLKCCVQYFCYFFPYTIFKTVTRKKLMWYIKGMSENENINYILHDCNILGLKSFCCRWLKLFFGFWLSSIHNIVATGSFF